MTFSEEDYDVIVAGGGPSGSMAALAAARNGANVLLLEQYAFLGGTLTAMGVGPMLSFHNNVGEQVIQGYPEELVQRLMAMGGSPGHVEDVITYCATMTPFDAEALKIALEEMLTEAGVTILYHTMLVGVERKGARVEAVIGANKAGLTRFRATYFIDSTGDGDLSYRAGLPFKYGRDKDQLTQPMTMKLKVGNVDREALKRYAKNYPERCLFDYGEEEGLARLERSPRISLKAFIPELKAARDAGEVNVQREFVLLFETGSPGTFIINVSRIQGLNGTDPYDISKAEMIGRQQCTEIFEFLVKRCPGFEQAIRMDTSAQVGIRETRRIEGLYTMTEEDVLEGKIFADSLVLGGYPIDIHSPDKPETETKFFRLGTIYGVPLRSVLTSEVTNLFMNGRCLSATHEALAGIRTTPQLMGLGQGVGTVAAMAVETGKPPLEIPFADIRAALEEEGAFLTVPEDFYMYSEQYGKDTPLDDPNQYIFSTKT